MNHGLLLTFFLKKYFHLISVYRKHRQLKQGGGVFVCCKDTIPCKEVHINNECEAVVCQISLKSNKNLIVCSFYRPPGHDIQYAINLCNLFPDICTAFSSSLIWLAGDLNLPSVDWKYCNLLPCNLLSSLCNIFIDFYTGIWLYTDS